MYFALKYMYGSGSRGVWAPKYDFMSMTLLGLGIASFLFHASLRQTLEFADELSMLILTWSLLQSTLTTRQSHSRAQLISGALAIIYTSFSVFYIWSAKIIYQVIAFAIAIVLITLRTQYLFHWASPKFPATKSRNWNIRTWQSLAICVFGYLIWHIDLEFCAELRAIRQRVGLPWAWLFEFHGWWHILTAIGADRFMNVAREVREEVDREKRD